MVLPVAFAFTYRIAPPDKQVLLWALLQPRCYWLLLKSIEH